MLFALERLPIVGRLLQRLGVNAVPAAGFFAAGWSPGTLIALYWLETVLTTATTALVIVLHRRTSRKAGHWICALARDGKKRVPAREGSTFLRSFLGIMTPFTLVHGVFVAAIAGVFLPRQTDGAGLSAGDLRSALAWLCALVLAGLLIDLVGLRDRSFAWVERSAQRVMGRMFIIHMTIVFGMMAMAATQAPRALFAVFVGLKTLTDLGSVLPATPSRETPPRWLAWLDRVKKSKKGESFADYWRRATIEERQDQEANEALWSPASVPAALRPRQRSRKRAR